MMKTMMNKTTNKTNKELEMMELNDEELDQVNGETLDERIYLGTGAAIFGLFFFQIPGAIIAAIWGSDDTPLFPPEEQKKAC